MIFLSAQPDTIYFVWQVELQLFNLIQKGWPIEGIHVLFAYNPQIGINQEAMLLHKKFPNSQIYFYEDTRENKKYSSTIRPHIIEKHFLSFPKLRENAIFYIDSDVIFREMPDFSILLSDDNWYASDTRSYMSCDLLINLLGKDIFENMCNIVGISPEAVLKNKHNTGGAQYIIKNTPLNFWHKVEDDSNKLYEYLYTVLFIDTDHGFFKNYPISIWITEMWAVYWNTILLGKAFTIHPLLDFCWANQTKEQWNKVYMLHYTGGIKGDFFKKTNYTYTVPYYSDLSYVSDKSSSAIMKDLITSYRLCLDKERIVLNDVTFIVLLKDANVYSRIGFEYLLKNISSNFIVIGTKPNLNMLYSYQSNNIRLIEVENYKIDNMLTFISTNVINTAFMGIISADYILPFKQVLKAIETLKKNEC